jgi:alkylated DNA repair dioxygenase AlkB
MAMRRFVIVKKKEPRVFDGTITLTFGDVAENHKGMQKLGVMAKDGFSEADLRSAGEYFVERGCDVTLHDLRGLLPESVREESEWAGILVIRGGMGALGVNADDLYEEQAVLDWDRKKFAYGKVMNKNARHNVCYADFAQEPDYERGRGRVVAYDSVPLLNRLRVGLSGVLKEKGEDLKCEGNRYYDVKACGIGWHGDSERKRVVAFRVGASMRIGYQWYKEGERVGERFVQVLNHGDMYIMSEKAVGWDWKRRKVLTLRHSAGCDKFMA